MQELELLKLRPLLREQQLICIKAHTQNQSILAHTLEVAILTSYKKLSVGYFELKLHIQTLGISATYFTSCKKEHNRSPLSQGTFSTFMHLADAFIQSDLHCTQVTVFTFYQLLLSLGIEPMILALLAPCSTIWAKGSAILNFWQEWKRDSER